jgi:hypothetical protein
MPLFSGSILIYSKVLLKTYNLDYLKKKDLLYINKPIEYKIQSVLDVCLTLK